METSCVNATVSISIFIYYTLCTYYLSIRAAPAECRSSALANSEDFEKMADVIESNGDSCTTIDVIPEPTAAAATSHIASCEVPVNPSVSVIPRNCEGSPPSLARTDSQSPLTVAGPPNLVSGTISPRREVSILQSLPPSPARSPIPTVSELPVTVAESPSNTIQTPNLGMPAHHDSVSTEQCLPLQSKVVCLSETTPAQQPSLGALPPPSNVETVANHDYDSTKHQPSSNISSMIPVQQPSPVGLLPSSVEGMSTNCGFESTIHHPPVEVNVSSGTSQQPLPASPVDGTAENVSDGNGHSSNAPRRTQRNKGITAAAAVSPLPSIPSKRRNADMADPSRSKRARKAPIEKAATAACPPGAAAIPPPPASEPVWFLNAMEVLHSENLGEEWMKLVEEWGNFEKQQQFVEVKRLPSKGRPEVVTTWISRGRKISCRPEINDLKAYETQFKTWWVGLQPDWRVMNGEVVKTSVEGDWDCLRLSGCNGFLSILAALFFWGIAARNKPVRRKVWSSAVEDCFMAISNVCH
jgi:hypothetical protein